MQAFLEKEGGDWPVVEDDSGMITLGYGVSKIPESYLIAPGGTVVAKFISGVDAETVTEVIERFAVTSGPQPPGALAGARVRRARRSSSGPGPTAAEP